MLWGFGRERPSVLDEPIARILTEMNHYGPDSPEYPVLVKHLSKLVKLKEMSKRKRISSDMLLQVSGNVLVVLIIVAYEQRHPMISKGLGFINKPK